MHNQQQPGGPPDGQYPPGYPGHLPHQQGQPTYPHQRQYPHPGQPPYPQHYVQHPMRAQQQRRAPGQQPPYPQPNRMTPPGGGVPVWVWIVGAVGAFFVLLVIVGPGAEADMDQAKANRRAGQGPSGGDTATGAMGATSGDDLVSMPATGTNALPSKPTTRLPSGRRASKGTARDRRRIAAALRALVRQGRSMQGVRGTASVAKLRRCGDLMRAGQRQARSLRAEAEKLGSHMLAVAAARALSCVSCSQSAVSSCMEVSMALREAMGAGR